MSTELVDVAAGDLARRLEHVEHEVLLGDSLAFIPIKLTGSDSVINSRSIFRASIIISRIRAGGTLLTRSLLL